MGKETNKKILNAADHNQENAVNKAKKKGLGPAMFPIKKASNTTDVGWKHGSGVV